MLIYNDYSCKKIADDYYLVFILNGDKGEEEIGGFNGKELFIYPKFKGQGLGYLIRLFMKDVGAI